MADVSIGLDFAWRTAATEAVLSRHEFIEPEHLFIGVCRLGNLPAQDNWGEFRLAANEVASLKTESEAVSALFSQARIDRVAVYREVRKQLGTGGYPELRRWQKGDIGLVAIDSPRNRTRLRPMWGCDRARWGELARFRTGHSCSHCAARAEAKAPPPLRSFLQQFGRDLTQLARDGIIQPRVGRRDEMLQVIRALGCDVKNNPVWIQIFCTIREALDKTGRKF